jgi:beta-galactosidase
MPIAEWAEVAWLKLGERDLKAGEHTIDIRLTPTKNEKGETQRVLYASDALVVAQGEFRPNGPNKPGQSGRTPADEAAGKNIFKVPAATGAARSQVSLQGQWEIARDDEQLPREIAVPIGELPKNPNWKSIAVPASKAQARPELTLAHRVWYRTRVEVPANMAGRSFFINFPKNNLNTTVYVNGVLCGFEKNPFVNFDVDVTKAIKPGVNEVMVGIRDAWYGFTHNPDNPMKLRKLFNYPATWASKGFMDLDYPVWNAFQSGILNTPTFVAAGGPAYVSDVFAQPSVAKKQMIADVEVTNPGNAPVAGEIQWEAVNSKTGLIEKTFARKPFTVAAGQKVVVKAADAWADPKLWWPDSPTLYDLRTTLLVGGQPVDISNTRFGFREWSWAGTRFKLNGINWNMWAIIGGPSGAKEWLAYYRRNNLRTMRFATEGQGGDNTIWNGLETREALRFFDENGVNVRRNGPLDGEVIGYNPYEGDEAIKAKQGGSRVKMELMKNTRDQMVAQVRGERNHPSIHIWTFDNEFLFINIQNLGGSDEYEPELTKISRAVTAADPTRPNMVDGGGAAKDNSLPVHGDHYLFDIADPRYPDLAYEDNVGGSAGSGRGRWVWDKKRPRFPGEDYFATGSAPAEYAQWGGEVAFQSKTATKPAAMKLSRMLSEGYRWAGVAAFHFWFGEESVAPGFQTSFEGRAAFIRQWDWTFGSGEKVTRTVGLFNDTRFADSLAFKWTFLVNGKTVATDTSTHNIAPGTDKKFDIVIPMPQVTTRTEGQLVLTLTAKGKEVFRDTKAVSVMPAPQFGAAASTAKPAAGKRRTAAARTSSFQVTTRSHAQMKPGASAASRLVVFDPQGNVAAYLKSRAVPFTRVTSLETLPANGQVLVVGKDAISESDSTSTRLAAYAATGRTVIVLEQKTPLKYGALQAEMETSNATGNVGFIEDSNHPALRNLKDKDFFTWGVNQPLYRNAYVKPTRGAKSLVQTHTRLLNSALVEIPTGKGLMLLSQLTVGEELPTNRVAQTCWLTWWAMAQPINRRFARLRWRRAIMPN